jgi:NAD(P)-dependent dehydrogenase (short-subunit alcohol dehydrogenase family)
VTIKEKLQMLLEGKNAIVTGGSQGIGTAASLELAGEGRQRLPDLPPP